MARDDDAARYRQAAQMTLDQLDWCVDYLRSIHKNRMAKQLARNRATIKRRVEEAGRAGTRPAAMNRLPVHGPDPRKRV